MNINNLYKDLDHIKELSMDYSDSITGYALIVNLDNTGQRVIVKTDSDNPLMLVGTIEILLNDLSSMCAAVMFQEDLEQEITLIPNTKDTLN